MPTENIGNHVRTKTYKNIDEYINEQREIEKGYILERHEKWSEENEKNIANLRKHFEWAYTQARELEKFDPVTKQKWVNVKGLIRITKEKGPGSLGGRWKIGYSVNAKGEVQYFMRKLPESIKISSPEHKGVIPSGEIINPT